MKKEDYVFCVDSDGCAMDTMTYKHQLYFGPLAADIFDISDKKSFLKEWDRVNLYSKTRGVNRFVGLLMGLEFADVKNIESLKAWIESTDSLSNPSLETEISQNSSDDLEKALLWSEKVNKGITTYEGEAVAFTGALEGLEKLKSLGRVYVVSSANKEAVQEEWQDQGLMDFVDDLYCQDRGKKEDVITQLIKEGYRREHILMIGDSPGDLSAADQNQVSFFPILVGHETESWFELKNHLADDFVIGKFDVDKQEKLKANFWKNLE